MIHREHMQYPDYVYPDDETRDHFESLALYDLLEQEVVPLFYERGVDGLPRRG